MVLFKDESNRRRARRAKMTLMSNQSTKDTGTDLIDSRLKLKVGLAPHSLEGATRATPGAHTTNRVLSSNR